MNCLLRAVLIGFLRFLAIIAVALAIIIVVHLMGVDVTPGLVTGIVAVTATVWALGAAMFLLIKYIVEE